MRIENLRECIKLAQTLNFTETAKALYVSQPVLSKHISSVEQELGARLFDRGQQGVSLTPVGKIFIERAREIVKEYEMTVSEVEQAKRGYNTTLTVGCLFGASYPIFPKATNRFISACPDVFLRIQTFEIDDIVEALDSEAVDMCVTTSYNMDFLQSSDRYEWVPLYPDAISVVVPSDFPEAQAEELSIDDLRSRALVQSCAPFMTGPGDDLIGAFASVPDGLHVRRAVLDLDSLILMMQGRKNISVSFDHLRYLLGDDFSCVPLKEATSMDFSVGVLWRRGNDSSALRVFVESLEYEAKKLLGGGLLRADRVVGPLLEMQVSVC